MSQITGGNSTDELHPLSVLEEHFKLQKADQEYSVRADGKGIALSQFYGGKKLIAKPTKIVAEIKGARRTAGARDSDGEMQSAMGNIGDHERAVNGRDAEKTYQGGHLISDKLLGDDSYVERNFVPMHKDLNSPDYRNYEKKAEKGLIDKLTKAKRLDVPLTMTVEVVYTKDPYTIDLALLHANNIIPSTFTKTDGGATTITFPRRVPASIKADVTYDTAAYPGLCFRVEDVGSASDGRLGGQTADVAAMPIDGQASQDTIWGMDSVVADGDGTNQTGGMDVERFYALQPFPQSVADQPKHTGGKKVPIVRNVPAAAATTVFKGSVHISEFTDISSMSFGELKAVYGDVFATKIHKAVKRRKNFCLSKGRTFDKDEVRKEFDSLAVPKHKKMAAALLKDKNVSM